MKKEFVNLHTHTNLGSMLDALNDVNILFDKAAEFGHKALAITDHGTLAAHFDAFYASKRTGVKFIPGCEAYFVNSYDLIEVEGKLRKERRRHIILLAQNEVGYKNLLKLNYIGFQNHDVSIGRVFPKINWEVLEEHSEGLIVTSACGAGPISRKIMEDNFDGALEIAKRFATMFPGRFFLELHPHHLSAEGLVQERVNRDLIKISKTLDIPLSAAADSHYPTRDMEKYHDVMLAINSKRPVDDPTRHRYGIDEFYIKHGGEIWEFLSEHYGEDIANEALANTVKIADMCEPPDYMSVEDNHLPIFPVEDEPDYKDFMIWKENKMPKVELDRAYMRYRCVEGFKTKFGHLPKDERKRRWERVIKELRVLEGNNFSSYMLVVSDFIKWAKNNEVLVGVGRGCLSGDSLVLTSGGYKPLKNIKIGDMVCSNNGKFNYVEGTFKYDVSNEAMLEIRTDYSFGNIILTKDHEVYGSKSKKTKRYKLYLKNNWKPPFKGKKNEIDHKPEWIAAKNLNIGDFAFMPFPERPNADIVSFDLSEYINEVNYSFDDNYIYHSVPLNNEFSIRKISKNTGISRPTLKRYRNTGFCTNKSLNILNKYLCNFSMSGESWRLHRNCEIRKTLRYLSCNEEFCYIIGRWIGDGWIIDKNNTYSVGFAFHRDDVDGKKRVKDYFEHLGIKCGIVSHRSKKLDQLYIYSYVFAKFFRDLFPEYKDSSRTKSLGIFQGLPENKLKNILIGLKHSDGSTEKNRECIDTVSLSLLCDIRQALLYLKIPSSVITRDPYMRGKYYCNKSYKIRFTGLESPTSSRIKDRVFDNGYYVQIKDKKITEEKSVYDIHVKNEHSYLTQNYAVHNSVGGSLVAYLLDIHGVDPLEYGLLFERFQNIHKTELPDIDTDFTSAGRDAVQEYVREKYGRDHCAQVSNINTYTPKNVIPDLVKSMRNVMPNLVPAGTNYVRVSEAIKAAIPDKIKTMEKALEESAPLREFARQVPQLMEYAKVIIGMPKEYSTHAAGMVISDEPIVNFAPLRVDKNGTTAIQYEKNRCEAIGLVKMDFLAISTLDIIDETFKNIENLNITDGPKCMEDIPLNDEATYKMIGQGQTRCVFQLGKSGIMPTLCKKIGPKSIVDIAIINALGRPSCKKERQEYVSRRFDNKTIEYLHPSLENSLKESYGLCIMEEQLMSVAADVAGWDLNKADGLRKLTKLKEKGKDLALKLETDFVADTMKKHDISYELAKEIWDEVVEKFSGYGFNKSHAVFYSINGYITAYLKRHYPAAFLAAFLKVKTMRGGITKDEEISMAKTECRRLDIKIVPPDINRSSAGYEVLDDKTIVMGFAAIKGLGDKGVNEIVSCQPYSSFVNFLYRTAGRVINKSKLEALSKAGCFDSLSVSRKSIFEEGKKTRDKLNAFLRKKSKDGYDGDMAIESFPLKLEVEEWPKQQLLRYEQEVLGELISGDINELYAGFFDKVGTTPFARLKNLPDRAPILVEAVVKAMLREFKIKTGNYKGQLMIKYQVEDIYGSQTELTVWPDRYDKAKKYLSPGKPFKAECQVSEFNTVKTIMLREFVKVTQ